jgi:quinol monooxygenase YgiN
MSVYSIIAKIRIKEDQMDQAMAAVKELVAGVTGEEGCLLYTVNTVKEDPNLLVFMERYRDREALQHHGQTPHFKKFFEQAGAFADGQPEMNIMREAVSA